VYTRIAIQIQDGLENYNTIPYGKQLSEGGRDLPEYFFQPLYKHPPLFTFFITFFMRIFGNDILSAGMVSVLLSSLMIPMIFLLGKLIYDENVGLFSALCLWLDPVSIITSQKVWPDTMMAFFTLLTVLFFVLAIKKKKDIFSILSGIASGLAANTKYTGILITVVIIIFTMTYRRELFKNKNFLFSLIMPVILLMPWLLWNYNVYGLSSISHHAEMRRIFIMIKNSLYFIIPILVLAFSAFLILLKKMGAAKKDIDRCKDQECSDVKCFITSIVPFFVIFVFVFLMKDHILNSLNSAYFPDASWAMGYFRDQPSSFYFGRLIEFFFIYFFSFIAVLLFNPNEKTESALVRLSGILILVFFVTWGNYQSRYILSCIPFLILLGTDLIFRLYQQIDKAPYLPVKFAVKATFIVFLVIVFIKVGIIDQFMSFPHGFCYY
jgi:4-amino-4-deoxy-L-arabinose transferase-like glycosyltransferase